MAWREPQSARENGMQHEQPKELAAREATTWLIALQEDPDDPDLSQRFERWRLASPLNEAAWLSTQRILEIGQSVPPRPSDNWPAFLATRNRRPSRSKPSPFVAMPSTRWKWAVPVLGVAMAAALAFAVGPSLLVRLEADHLTSTAELRDVRLPDGSLVTLSAKSAIAVSANADERMITLIEGEAFFQVKADAARPFRVISGPVRTTVLGTRFDVRRDSYGVSVGVEEGSVQVDAPSSTERLQAGEAVRLEFGGEVARSRSQLTTADWRRGAACCSEYHPAGSRGSAPEVLFGGDSYDGRKSGDPARNRHLQPC